MIDFPGFGGPFARILDLIQGLATAVGMVILLLVWIALLVLLVRFLWFGTKAAQRYLAVNPAPDAAPGAPTDPAPTAPSAPARGTKTGTAKSSGTTKKPAAG